MMFFADEEFQKFVELAKGKSKDEVIRAAENEHRRGDRPSRRDEFREQKLRYRALMGGLIFWLNHRIKPTGLRQQGQSGTSGTSAGGSSK
jgi:hypothetical protein